MRGSVAFLIFGLLNFAYGGSFITFTFSGRANKLYLPTTPQPKAPLFVMLHGCTQNPTDFSAGTQMNTFGETYGFYVLYPEQTSGANANKCWNWFQPADQARGTGEPKLITDMVAAVAAKYSIDESRVFAAGLSAGAAMAVIVGATYPDVFSGIAVGAGLEYQAATSMVGAFTAMSSGGPDPVQQGKAAYAAAGSNARTVKVYVIHGTSDTTVFPVNGKQVVSQWVQTLLLDGNAITNTPTNSTNGQVPGGHSYTLSTYANGSSGNTLIQYLVVNSMAHAWSGGSTAGSYTDPKGPDASALIVNFFLASQNGSTTTTSSTSSTGTTGPVTTATGNTTSSSSSTTGTTGTTGAHCIPNTPCVAKFASIGSEDGYVSIIDGCDAGVCKFGDKGGYSIDIFRTILSFDTTTIPEGATITKATLTVTLQSASGTIVSIPVDINNGVIANELALVPAKYYDPVSQLNAFELPVPTTAGQQVSVDLPASALQHILTGASNPVGRTQLRLHGSITVPTAGANYRIIYGGESQQYAPTLAVTFQYA
eukprot:TRINITY_DN6189_c0_g1_i1.p1 TRINITY_DN6189_c0_g1~~TRINITY_DN6189_c0_g1_i1.p1  ORF type:complete len:559 (-),score=68.67 TRINITY_DN6189_c0_g1_i1:304-1917(-)